MLGTGLRRVSKRTYRFSLQGQRLKNLQSTCAQSPERRPSISPRLSVDIRSIRQRPELYSQNCSERNYEALAGNPQEIAKAFQQWSDLEKQIRVQRERNNVIQSQLGRAEGASKVALLQEARQLKDTLKTVDRDQKSLLQRIETLAIELPNLTSSETPRGIDPKPLEFINQTLKAQIEAWDPLAKDHVRLGAYFGILDFESATTSSGWGWYYLKKEGALLAQALVQYAIHTAMKHGFDVVEPPSMVYSHIGAACGFRPRDQQGEQQVFSIQQTKNDIVKDAPSHSLAATAEIPFAGMNAQRLFENTDLPLCVVGSSRCYRAEAGARGVQTKGLYRVHEFTKVEMFAWTAPNAELQTFHNMVDVQKEILLGLGLYCRVLEMPSTDLGASAFRKWDIEAYFPSRAGVNEGWGEVTSASICTDYQTRRLDTRMKGPTGFLFPSTVNGTALAVPRVLAAILEYGYEPDKDCIRIPEALWPFMHGIRSIERPQTAG